MRQHGPQALDSSLLPLGETDFTFNLTANTPYVFALPANASILLVCGTVNFTEGQAAGGYLPRTLGVIYSIPVIGRKQWFFTATSNGTINGKILTV